MHAAGYRGWGFRVEGLGFGVEVVDCRDKGLGDGVLAVVSRVQTVNDETINAPILETLIHTTNPRPFLLKSPPQKRYRF